MRKLDDSPIEFIDPLTKEKLYLKPTFELNTDDNGSRFGYYIEEGDLDSEGNFIATGRTNLDEIKVIELNNLVNSNVIGTNFNYNKQSPNRNIIPSIFN